MTRSNTGSPSRRQWLLVHFRTSGISGEPGCTTGKMNHVQHAPRTSIPTPTEKVRKVHIICNLHQVAHNRHDSHILSHDFQALFAGSFGLLSGCRLWAIRKAPICFGQAAASDFNGGLCSSACTQRIERIERIERVDFCLCRLGCHALEPVDQVWEHLRHLCQFHNGKIRRLHGHPDLKLSMIYNDLASDKSPKHV